MTNENFVPCWKILRTQVSTPLAGQLWWDTAELRLKVYTGTAWTTGGGPIVGPRQPSMVAGDLWINNDENQLYFFDGTDLELAGPIYNSFQGRSGPQVVTVLDNTGTSRTIVKYWVGGTLVGLWSKIAFVPQNIDTIPNFTGNVVKGFNVVDSDFIFAGTASKTESLVDSQGIVRTAAQFLASDSDDSTSGALSIRNNNGMTVGLTDNHVVKVTNLGVVAENNVSGEDYILRMTTSLGKRDAITVKSADNRVGIYNDSPAETLDVGGNVKISGNLTVEGSTTTIDSSTLRVEDKNIELGIGSDSTLLTDSQVDSAGIIVKSANGDKEFLWRQATNSWTTDKSINLTGSGKLKSNGVDIIDGTDAPGITSIGNLTSANIGNISFTGGIGISTGVVDGSGNGLNLTLAGNMNFVTPRKISGVSDPTGATDVTTKNYVDTE